jgi:hypothetical protein
VGGGENPRLWGAYLNSKNGWGKKTVFSPFYSAEKSADGRETTKNRLIFSSRRLLTILFRQDKKNEEEKEAVLPRVIL